MSAPTPEETTWATLRRGLALSPELRTGLAGTLALALVSLAGRAAAPVAVQRAIDHGVNAPGGPDVGAVVTIVTTTAVVLAVTSFAGYLMVLRLFTVSETALANLRVRAFRHVHDLSMLHQQTQRRGTLVSRVTSDVDQITQFLQWGGVILIVSAGQIVVTTIVMLVYSWQLTLLMYAVFLPGMFVIRSQQRRLGGAYAEVRQRVGAMLGAVSESVVGAQVIRAYGVAGRTARRLDEAVDRHRRAQYHALRTSVFGTSIGELAAGLALATVVVAGTVLGAGGTLSIGTVTAFLFLVTMFVQPVQIATEVLNEAQNAIAGWRRVLDVLDLTPDVADPGDEGVALPAGPVDIRFRDVQFAYGAAGPLVLRDIDVEIGAKSRVAIVGETGSGKTTFAKLLTRLMDPTAGSVDLTGVPLPRVRFDSLRSRVVMVPQDGFLFDATVAGNIRFAAPGLSDADLRRACGELGLGDWLDGLPAGLDTPVGERGEALSVGERQLVALVRAYVADPDLLVLDEATSAVDPATEVRLQRALEAVTRGRTTVIIAHRLSTAEVADEVLVFDAGRIVQRGPHDELVAAPDSVYGRLHASWLAQTR